jgi:hypothetical protein
LPIHHGSIDGLSRVAFHRPSIEVTEPRVPPPDLIHVLINRQESDQLAASTVLTRRARNSGTVLCLGHTWKLEARDLVLHGTLEVLDLPELAPLSIWATGRSLEVHAPKMIRSASFTTWLL